MKQRIKIEQIKGKTCHVCFVKVIKFQENRFKIIQNNFQEMIIIIITIMIIIINKDFLEKPPVTMIITC